MKNDFFTALLGYERSTNSNVHSVSLTVSKYELLLNGSVKGGVKVRWEAVEYCDIWSNIRFNRLIKLHFFL